MKSGERTAASVKRYLMKEPLSGDELLHYRFTRRKKELADFDASESGMTACFRARYENRKGRHGGRSYRRLFRKEKFIGYNGGDRGFCIYTAAQEPAAFFCDD